MRLPWWSLALGFGMSLTQGGCTESAAPPPGRMDGSPGLDADPQSPLPPAGDEDGDGLCNGGENDRGTDPRSTDSDGDGFSDYVEVIHGLDPLAPASPDRSRVLELREQPDAALAVPVEVVVQGSGEDFRGAFEALPVRRDPSGGSAEAFYGGSSALAANPESNVAALEPENETFRGVLGRTELFFEVRLAFGSNEPRDCLHAYRFRYNVKRADGRTVANPLFLLLVLPPGARLGSTGWCPPPPSCL